MKGKVIGISGPTVTVDLRGLKLYDRVAIGEGGLLGEVVRLERERTLVQVYEDTRGLALGESVSSLGKPLALRLGPGLLGTIFDGLQRPLEGLREAQGPFLLSGSGKAPPLSLESCAFTPLKKPGEEVMAGEAVGWVQEGPFRHFILAPVAGTIERIADGECSPEAPVAHLTDGSVVELYEEWPVREPRPFRRKLAPREPLITGQRCIDFLFPLARGGTSIFPGGFGTGKTILEQSIAKFAAADIVIYVGCGERGNEMAEMLEEFASLKDPWTDEPLMARTVTVANTSNMPVAAREASIYTAVTMGEYFRDMGYHVLLLADSLSRWAEALREISSSLEEMPGEEGYPTYLASRLAAFMARSGTVETLGGATGSLTMILSVSPPGGDFTEPVTQACLRTTGSFLMLDTALAHRRHFPAIHWFQSFSLYQDVVHRFEEEVSSEWTALRRECRDILKREEELREVAEIVGLSGMQDEDRLAMTVAERIRLDFLCQNAYTEDAFSPPEETLARIGEILAFYRKTLERLGSGEILDDILGG